MSCPCTRCRFRQGQSGPTLGNWTNCRADETFVSGRRRSIPSFDPGRETALAAGDICRRLDGLPLAIELAAAHCRLLPRSVVPE